MANANGPLSVPPILRQIASILIITSLGHTQDAVVFQQSYLIASGPEISTLLVGKVSNVSLSLKTVSPSSATGNVGPPSCVGQATQWVVSQEPVGKIALQVHLRLDRSLRLCGDNETDTDCCLKPLCVLETLQLSACVNDTPQAAVLIQARIHARLHPVSGSEGNTTVPNQFYQTLGPCPCDLKFSSCDVRCCCDEDCSTEELKLFGAHCLPGPFGGQVSPPPDYQCSAQSTRNSPDWFPFLCVTSPPENNPHLGLFYKGNTITPKPGPSFQTPVWSAPTPVNFYIQGSPLYMPNDQYFTIPQKVLGQCINGAPVAFLENFNVTCVTLLRSCPSGPPLLTEPSDLRIRVNNGQGGDVTVDVMDEVAYDLAPFVSSTDTLTSSGGSVVCKNVTVAMDYKLYWEGNSITSVTLTRTVGSITLNTNVFLTTRYSAVFLNGQLTAQANSGNPGYQIGRPLIAGVVQALGNNTDVIQRTSIELWKPGDGFCFTAEKEQVLYGHNSTAGCLLPVSLQNLSQCDSLRETVISLQGTLVRATYVAKSGKPDHLSATDWVKISFGSMNASTTMDDTAVSCSRIPSHQHIHVWSLVTGTVDGVPQREIRALNVSYSLSNWELDCGGGDVSPCADPTGTELFPVTSSVTFIDIPINTGPPKSRFQINFTEYDCNRNDVCWPELAFPLTRYYTGEPYSQSLAKGLILVFFFVAASVLGTPWRQIRQAWNSAAV
ncbi:tectonic-2 [Nelusetta ayraudi]|uniref:tectonic-2 n=1 Tax=Nelusetta ayraudi TaxID=303726 RepID=UPI003F6F7D14